MSLGQKKCGCLIGKVGLIEFGLREVRKVGQCLRNQASRNFVTSAVAFQKLEDPIQQLFVQKIREYAEKQKATKSQLVDATPDVMKSFHTELDLLATAYRAKGEDMKMFPEFSFKDQPLEVPKSNEDRANNELPL